MEPNIQIEKRSSQGAVIEEYVGAWTLLRNEIFIAHDMLNLKHIFLSCTPMHSYLKKKKITILYFAPFLFA